MKSEKYLKILVEDIHSTIVATMGEDGHPVTRAIDKGTKANNECECIYRQNDSLDSLEIALQEAFTFLGIVVDVDFHKDFRKICAVELPEKKKEVEFPKADAN